MRFPIVFIFALSICFPLGVPAQTLTPEQEEQIARFATPDWAIKAENRMRAYRQRNEHYCKSATPAIHYVSEGGEHLDSKKILTKTLEEIGPLPTTARGAGRPALPPPQAVDKLLCGIEEFAVYDDGLDHLTTRASLNRARYLVTNFILSPEIRQKILIRAFTIAMDYYFEDNKFPKGTNFYAGLLFASEIVPLKFQEIKDEDLTEIYKLAAAWLSRDLYGSIYRHLFSEEILTLNDFNNSASSNSPQNLSGILKSTIESVQSKFQRRYEYQRIKE